jgi:hypothetical protein
MKSYETILILFLMLCIPNCMQTSANLARNNYTQSEFTIVTAIRDSTPVSDSTKYFYRYVFNDISRWDISPVWALANLGHFGIKVNEAWYYGGASNSYIGNGAFGKTIVPPSLVVGLTEYDSEILNHNFVLIEHFDPSGHPNGPDSRFTHYVQKQIK